MHHLQIEFKRDRSTVTNLPNLSPCRIGKFRSLSHSLLSPNPYLRQILTTKKCTVLLRLSSASFTPQGVLVLHFANEKA